jgi:hypothetical protein
VFEAPWTGFECGGAAASPVSVSVLGCVPRRLTCLAGVVSAVRIKRGGKVLQSVLSSHKRGAYRRVPRLSLGRRESVMPHHI